MPAGRQVPRSALFIVLALCLAAPAQALTGPGGIMCPTGTNPSTSLPWALGDTYQLVFLTSTTRDASSTDIAVYNAFVNTAADGSPLTGVPGVTWYAIASTYIQPSGPGVNAKDNALVSAPVYRLDLALVATGFDDMWNSSISNPINVTEQGIQVSAAPNSAAARVWTGSHENGTFNTARSLGSTTHEIMPGYFSYNDGNWWISGSVSGVSRFDLYPLYALSETLTIVAPSTIGLSSPINATIIAGGSGAVGATVSNTASTGGDMNYTLTGAIASGDGSVGAAASGTLAPGTGEAKTVSVFSENVGENTVTLTVASADADNSPQSTTATLTVLAHSDAKFVAGTGGTQTPSSGGNAIEVDFGSVAQGAGGGFLTADLSLLNFETVSGYTAALDLDAFDFSGYDTVLALDELYVLWLKSTSGDKAIADSQTLNLTFDTTVMPGTYLATYTFKLSDQNLSGASAEASETLILTLKGTVTPEPATLALLGLGGLGMLLSRKRK